MLDTRRTLADALLVIGALLLVLGAFGYARAAVAQSAMKERWDELPALPAAQPVAPRAELAVERPRAGEAVARLRIPRLGLDAVVLEGIDAETLALAPGHYPGTALPGEGGHVVLSAHRDSFFKDLGRLEPGDPISVARPGGVDVTYRVTRSYIVYKTNRTVIVPLPVETLTLITCYPFVYAGAAPYRYIVEAHPVPAADAGA